METQTSGNLESKAEINGGIARWVGQMVVSFVIYAILLFAFAGTLNWINGWAFLIIQALTQVISALVLIPRQAGMLNERSKVREGTKNWDRYLTLAVVLFGTVAFIITAGLDARFGWSVPPVSTGWWIVGLALQMGSGIFTVWAMASNPYFALTVRIQDERGHQVIRSGPYRIVRHPGYLGSLIFNVAAPLVLGSWWTFIPAGITILMTFIRTRLEDATLQDELPGYKEYAESVRKRLIPGLW